MSATFHDFLRNISVMWSNHLWFKIAASYVVLTVLFTICFHIIRLFDEGLDGILDDLEESFKMCVASLMISPFVVVGFIFVGIGRFIRDWMPDFCIWAWGKWGHLYRQARTSSKPKKLWKTPDGRMVRQDLILSRLVKEDS